MSPKKSELVEAFEAYNLLTLQKVLANVESGLLYDSLEAGMAGIGSNAMPHAIPSGDVALHAGPSGDIQQVPG